MNEEIVQIVCVLAGGVLMLSLIGLGVAVFMPGIEHWNKRFFIAHFSTLVLYVCFTIFDLIFLKNPNDTLLARSVYLFETLSSSFQFPMIMAFLLHSCGENWLQSGLFRAEAALWFLFFIYVSLSLCTSWIYHISPENQLIRGPLYPLGLFILLTMLLLCLFAAILLKNKLSQRYFYTFLTALLPITVTITIHFFVSIFTALGITVAMCALAMFSLVLSDQIEHYFRQQRELVHQHARIMVLQMRPHFIYNTMLSIYYLCKKDPDLAQRVTMDFTTYLRKNFTAIASENLIPFSEELEHTRAYLAVEQAQFDDRLFVDYDTPHTDFRLPPLTLQPIVENAVKHGMDPDSEPLHITIRTRKTVSGNEITVENDGAAFEPVDDNEPHIALKNIRQRLELMCHGQMTITPREGGGTIVKVTV